MLELALSILHVFRFFLLVLDAEVKNGSDAEGIRPSFMLSGGNSDTSAERRSIARAACKASASWRGPGDGEYAGMEILQAETQSIHRIKPWGESTGRGGAYEADHKPRAPLS